MNPQSSSSASEWITIDFPIDGKPLWPRGLTCSKVRLHSCSRLTALCRPLQALPHRKTTDPCGLRVGEMVRDLLLTTWRPWSLPVGGKDFLNSRSGGYWTTLSLFYFPNHCPSCTPSVPVVRLPHFGNSWELGICLFLLHCYARLHIVQRRMKRRPRHPASEVLEAEIRG